MPNKPIKLLATAYDYRPKIGGIATCAFELSRALSRIEGIDLKLLAPVAPGAIEFDAHGLYPTQRIELSARPEIATFQLAASLRTEVRAWKPDAVLNFLWLPEAAAAYLCNHLPFAPRTEYFVIAHGVEVLEAVQNARKKLRRLFAPVKRNIFRDARSIFAVSHYTRKLVHEHCGVPNDRIRVIYNAVDIDVFKPAPKPQYLLERYGLQGKKVFLSITRLVDYKGIDYAIAALAQLIHEHPEARYLVCGEGEDRLRLETLVQTHNLRKHVIFTGAIQQAELVDHYCLADCFVLLSRDDLITPNVEGFGIVFLEAAACAKPSIAGRSGGVPDAVEDGSGGWLVDPCDLSAIARAMRECLSRPEDATERGKNALARVQARFTWDHVAGNVMTEISQHVRNQRNRA